jgi:hypothetical protein
MARNMDAIYHRFFSGFLYDMRLSPVGPVKQEVRKLSGPRRRMISADNGSLLDENLPTERKKRRSV